MISFDFYARGNGNIAICACDCSQEALERTSEAITATGDEPLKHRFHPFQCDITSDRLPNWLFCCSCKEQILNGQLILDSGVYRIIVSLILLIYIFLFLPDIIC